MEKGKGTMKIEKAYCCSFLLLVSALVLAPVVAVTAIAEPIGPAPLPPVQYMALANQDGPTEQVRRTGNTVVLHEG